MTKIGLRARFSCVPYAFLATPCVPILFFLVSFSYKPASLLLSDISSPSSVSLVTDSRDCCIVPVLCDLNVGINEWNVWSPTLKHDLMPTKIIPDIGSEAQMTAPRI